MPIERILVETVGELKSLFLSPHSPIFKAKADGGKVTLEKHEVLTKNIVDNYYIVCPIEQVMGVTIEYKDRGVFLEFSEYVRKYLQN